MKATSSNNISNRRSSGFSQPYQNPSFIPNFISPLKQPNLKLPDVSFSTYLTPPDHHHVEKRSSEEARPKLNSSISSPPLDDSELSIFDARKYFNEPNNDPILKTHKRILALSDPVVHVVAPRLSSALSADGFGRNFRIYSVRSYVTPTASSEASWNSHTGLLSNPPGVISVSLRDPNYSDERKNGPPPGIAGSASPRWFVFCRKFPCSGKKTVQVKKRPTKARSPASRKNCRSKEEVVILPAVPGAHRSVNVAEDASTIVGSERSNFTATSTNSINPLLDSDKMEDFVANSYTRISLTSSVKLKPYLSCRDSNNNNNNNNNGPLTGGGSAGGFTSPLLNTSPPIKKVLNTSILPHLWSIPLSATDDPPRDSLEVFQPCGGGGGLRNSKVFNVKVLAYQAAPVAPRDIDSRLVVPFAPASPRDDDMASDASSDLFEIASFSTNQSGSSSYPMTRYPATRQRDSLEEARPRFSSAGNNNNNNGSGLNYDDSTTDYGYEPSEASVAWTVTTADGTAYDQASLAGCSVSASDVEEFTRLQVRLHHQLSDQRRERSGGEGGRQRDGPAAASGGGGILMSCRCEKAVSVGPDPIKCQPPPLRTAVAGNVGMMSNRSSGGGGYFRHGSGRAEGGNKPPLASSHTACLSLAFAT